MSVRETKNEYSVDRARPFRCDGEWRRQRPGGVPVGTHKGVGNGKPRGPRTASHRCPPVKRGGGWGWWCGPREEEPVRGGRRPLWDQLSATDKGNECSLGVSAGVCGGPTGRGRGARGVGGGCRGVSGRVEARGHAGSGQEGAAREDLGHWDGCRRICAAGQLDKANYRLCRRCPRGLPRVRGGWPGG